MRVGDVMDTRAITARPDDDVASAIRRMAEADVGSVAVCDGSRLVGIFTERDVLRLAAEGEEFGRRRLGDVMTSPPVTITPDASILDAAELMGERRIRHLPVVEDGNLHGVVGIRDLLAALVERLWQSHDEGAHETARRLLTRRS